jgi:hypothetical protein
MKQQTVEKILLVICVIAIIFMAKYFVTKQAHIDELRRAHIDSLEMVALKVDSLENIVNLYKIHKPDWNVKIEGNSEEFSNYFGKNFPKDSLHKVIILGVSNENGELDWWIQAKN